MLLVQALFFGAGGVTVLGVNALAMGLLGPLAGWLAWRLLRRLSERAALFAGRLGLHAGRHPGGGRGAGAAAPPRPGLLPACRRRSRWPAMLVPSLTVAGVVEGLYTVFALSLVRKAGLRGVEA